MALSQVQCLDNQHINSRVSESKPEFFYSEDQRLALEALVATGRDGFLRCVLEKGIRQFLSDPELEWLSRTAEAYHPGFEHPLQPTKAEGPGNLTPASADDQLSLQYWPDRSEASVAELDLGWPESISYRGITRVVVHTQPPFDGHTHIKQVVRKTIAAATKPAAVWSVYTRMVPEVGSTETAVLLGQERFETSQAITSLALLHTAPQPDKPAPEKEFTTRAPKPSEALPNNSEEEAHARLLSTPLSGGRQWSLATPLYPKPPNPCSMVIERPAS
ncbi:hypothetical protein CRUP_008787 [Coryphaenoides rupestris]|nr:hypothetical protein CRUP_008787 [Coryphaenoides rupestris]